MSNDTKTKKKLYAAAAELFQAHDLDGCFGDFGALFGDDVWDAEDAAEQVQKEIIAWLRKKAK